MPQIKKLYDKPKSLLREIIQKLFLKFLLKVFPKKFLPYKNKIRFIMNKSGFYLYFYLAVFFLRFRYPLYYRLSSRQIYALHITTKFLRILKPQKIDFFLLEGCLLGAVRQESFAGRPIDIDFGIKEDQLQKLLVRILRLLGDAQALGDMNVPQKLTLFPNIHVAGTLSQEVNNIMQEFNLGTLEPGQNPAPEYEKNLDENGLATSDTITGQPSFLSNRHFIEPNRISNEQQNQTGDGGQDGSLQGPPPPPAPTWE